MGNVEISTCLCGVFKVSSLRKIYLGLVDTCGAYKKNQTTQVFETIRSMDRENINSDVRFPIPALDGNSMAKNPAQ